MLMLDANLGDWVSYYPHKEFFDGSLLVIMCALSGLFMMAVLSTSLRGLKPAINILMLVIILSIVFTVLNMELNGDKEFLQATKYIEDSYDIAVNTSEKPENTDLRDGNGVPISFTYNNKNYTGNLELKGSKIRIIPETIVDENSQHYVSNFGLTNVDPGGSSNTDNTDGNTDSNTDNSEHRRR